MASIYWGIGEIHDRDKTISLSFKSGVLGAADQNNSYGYRIENASTELNVIYQEVGELLSKEKAEERSNRGNL